MLRNRKKVRLFCFYAISLMLFSLMNSLNVKAQSDLLSSQYMNSQLLINPAYAGVRNSFSVNLLSRQQWMGINDAPTTYAISLHSPLNKRMASLGTSLLHYQSGPVQHSELTAVYSYLIRLSHNMFLSMGLSAQVNHYNIGLNALDVIEDNDPSFAANFDNGIKPNFGAGTFLYTPKFFLGISVPKVLSSQLKVEEGNIMAIEESQSAYITTGYAIDVNKSLVVKPSFLGRLRLEESHLFDINLQLMYKKVFWVGGSYRTNNTMAALLNIQATKTLGVCYSYDFSIGNTNNFGVGSHEISLIIDSHRLIKRNRDRRFNRKKVSSEDEDKGVESIRYF